MARDSNYGVGGWDKGPAPKTKDRGTVEFGLTELTPIREDVREITEQSRFSSGERNESLPGGYKLVQ